MANAVVLRKGKSEEANAFRGRAELIVVFRVPLRADRWVQTPSSGSLESTATFLQASALEKAAAKFGTWLDAERPWEGSQFTAI